MVLMDKMTDSMKVKCSSAIPSILTHGLEHLHHLPCADDSVCHITHSTGPLEFLSLHAGGRVSSYHPDGQLGATFGRHAEFTGLTGTRLPGRIAGWGPGATLALLDNELRPLAHALDPLDIRVCQAAELTPELVTAGEGNVCVWCLAHLVCKVRVQEGLGPDDVYTQLALAPPTSGRHHRAFAACGSAVSIIDLTEGRLLEKRTNLHSREITSLVYCPLLDCLVTASRDVSIRVWSSDWDLLIAFVGHTGMVTGLACCPESSLIVSASLDGTLRCWSLEEGDQVQVVSAEGGGAPPLALVGPGKGGTFFSYSKRGVDFWSMASLYSLHCKLGDARGVTGVRTMQQIVVPAYPPPYPARAVCVTGDRKLAVVAAETGAILTTFSLGAGQKVKSVDYCLPKETLLVLTEDGAVLRASTLTNPATGLDEWQGRWEEPWPKAKQTEEEGENRTHTGPGLALCMTLYSALNDHREALEDWREIQELCDPRAVKRRSLHNGKNRFLVMLGQEGGCVSVLRWNSGEVLCRSPAHSGQSITALLADPENSYLFSSGEDKMVLVWRVCPFTADCLSLHLSLLCGQPPVHLASLGSLLALAIQEPDSATYSLVHLYLETQIRTEHPPSQDHLDCITGLCACPQIGVLVSSSQDGTIRIWDDENRLLRTLQLNAEPECLAFCGLQGGLLLGIRGDLYRIPSTLLLPEDLHIQLLCAEQFDPALDLPVSQTVTEENTHGYMTSVEEEEYQLEKNMAYATLVARSKDLESLQQGVVGSKKKRAHTTRQTKKEAFGRYLKLVYREPLKIEIPEKDVVGQQVALFSLRQPTDLRSLGAVTVREQARLLERGAEAGQGKGSSCDHRTSWGHIPNSVLLGQLWPDMVPEDSLPLIPWTLREGLGQLSDVRSDDGEVKLLVYDTDGDDGDEDYKVEQNLRSLLEKQNTLPKLMSPPPPSPPTPPIVERAPPRIKVPKRPLVVRFREPECPPPPTPKPPTPSKPQTAPEHSPPPSSPPCQCSLPHTPPRQILPPHSPPHQAPRTPTPPCQLPEFLSQFVDQDWFHEVCPDQSLLRESLSREEFAMLLLERLRCRHATPRLQILRALRLLIRQGALGNSEQISASLIDLLQLSATSSMSEEERRFVCELLKVLASLRPVSTGTVAELLTALAHRELGLQRVVIRLLKTMGVEEAEPWLSSCVASWQDGLQGRPDTWAHLRQVAAHWLDFWTSKYKDRALLFKGEEKKDPASPVDVLRFFCSVQRENQSRLPPPPPVGRRDTVLLPQHSDRPKPIQRLGETHSLARTRQTKGVTLPPLPHRPLLVGFVPFISLPLPRVSLSLFPQPREQKYPKTAPRRYFFPAHSYAHNYR